MGTMEQLEERLRPYKLAIIESFGLDPDKTSSSISAGRDSVTFKCVGVVPGVANGPLRRAIMSGTSDEPNVTTVEMEALHWTSEQRQAVEAYLKQFPGGAA